MGHIRLGSLPKTKTWNQVVELLGAGATAPELARASSVAARSSLDGARADAGVIGVVHALATLPTAARQTPGLVADGATLLDVTSAFMRGIDAGQERRGARSDAAELATLAAVETLVELVGRRLPTLFASSAAEVQNALASLATQRQFAILTRVFFARFLERYLLFYLSKETGAQVGYGKRFRSTEEVTSFNSALRRHCFETALIVEEYAESWWSKKTWKKSLTVAETARFTDHAMEKMSAELTKRETPRGD